MLSFPNDENGRKVCQSFQKQLTQVYMQLTEAFIKFVSFQNAYQSRERIYKSFKKFSFQKQITKLLKNS